MRRLRWLPLVEEGAAVEEIEAAELQADVAAVDSAEAVAVVEEGAGS